PAAARSGGRRGLDRGSTVDHRVVDVIAPLRGRRLQMAAPPDSFSAMLKRCAGVTAYTMFLIAALAPAPSAGQPQPAAVAPLTAKPDPESNIYYYTYVQESTALRAIQAASNGIQMLASGFTIVRDMGNNALYADTALRQAIEQGWIPGPTIINSGIIIGGMGGQFFPTPEMAQQHHIVYPEYLDADTPDEIVKAVRQNVLCGAKVIKICVDCKPYPYSADEIRLVIREAAKSGMKVEGHVQTLNGARNAIEAGIWSIAHSTGLNEEMHTLMAQKGIFRAGTDTPDTLAGHPVSPQAYQRTVASLKDAYAKKVPLTFSTDADYYVAGKTRGEVC